MLKEETAGLALAATHLQYSIARCADLIGQEHLPPEQLERLESLTSRFARVADLLTQRVFRLFDEFELTGPSTVLDRIYRAEKRGWLEASQMISIRELRNMIAHEYAAEKMTEIYAAVYALAQTLLIIVPNVTAAAQRLVART
jgi:hypothetical protein